MVTRTYPSVTLYVYYLSCFLPFHALFLASLLLSFFHAFSLMHPPLILHSPAPSVSSNSSSSRHRRSLSSSCCMVTSVAKHVHGIRKKKCIQNSAGKFLQNDNLEDHKEGVRIILNRVLRKYVFRI